MKRWVVREADARSLARVLALMGEVESAIAEGRVFLGRQRLSAERELSVGDLRGVDSKRVASHFDQCCGAFQVVACRTDRACDP